MVEFRVLGPLEAWRDGKLVDVRGAKRRALLAILVLNANEVLRRERLIDELWGEEPPSNATASLHNQVSRLRRDLGAETLITRPSGYVLRVDPDAVDLHRFQALIAEAQSLPAKKRSETLRAALAMWRGSPLTDLGGEEALTREIERLEETRANAIEQRIEADLELGHGGDLVPELEELVTRYPLRERLRAQLILALYRAGRQAEALETYRETRRVLVEDLGIEPSPELRELERAILRQDPSLSRVEAKAADSATPFDAPTGEPADASRRRRVLPVVMVAALGAAGVLAAVLVARGGGTDVPAGQAAGNSVKQTSNTAVTSTTPPPRTTVQATTTHHTTRTTGSTAATGPSNHHGHDGDVTQHTVTTTAKTTEATSQTSSSTGPHGPPVTHPAITKPPSKHNKNNQQSSAGGARVFLLADGFNTAAFNSALWDRGEAGTGVDFAEDGRLEVSIAANAAPGSQYNLIEGQYQTNCGLVGDFDARVSFQTVTWPQDNGISIVLGAAFPGDYAIISRASLNWGEGYWSNFGSWPRIVANDASGALRLVRTNGVITSYYRAGSRWVKVESRASPRAAANIVLQLANYTPPPYNGPVVAAFDNFRATAASVACPPGVPLPPRVRKSSA